MPQDCLDLTEVVKKWLTDFHADTNQYQEAGEITESDIDWTKVRIKHGPTIYGDQQTDLDPTTHVLSTSYFVNKSPQRQIFLLMSERRTKSICSISMDKTYTIGYHGNIKVSPPNPVIEANAGFKGEQSITDVHEQTFEEEMVWAVNNEILVPPRTQIKAELLLKEVKYNSKFKCVSEFTGHLNIKLRHKRTNGLLATINGDLQKMLTQDLGFRSKNAAVYFISEGQCKCRYGLEQYVRLSQTPVPGDFPNIEIIGRHGHQ